MTLEELKKQHPELAMEVDSIKEQAFADGIIEANAKIAKVTPYLGSESYPKAVNDLAIKVLNSEVDIAALISTVAVLDSQKEEAKSKEAQGETKKLPETPGGESPPDVTANGSIENNDDFMAAQQRTRQQMGMPEVT